MLTEIILLIIIYLFIYLIVKIVPCDILVQILKKYQSYHHQRLISTWEKSTWRIDSLKCYTALRHRVILIISECIISEVRLRGALCIQKSTFQIRVHVVDGVLRFYFAFVGPSIAPLHFVIPQRGFNVVTMETSRFRKGNV